MANEARKIKSIRVMRVCFCGDCVSYAEGRGQTDLIMEYRVGPHLA